MSTTYTATIILLLTAILNIFGIEVVEEQLQETVSILVSIGTAIWVLVERYRKGGISAFGLKK